MEQRRLRLGDILDDYCPRERRVTNHAVVAMVEEDVKQTRCTTCDAEHVYKGGREPRKRKKAETGALYREVLAGMPDNEFPGNNGHAAVDIPAPILTSPEAAVPSAADNGTQMFALEDAPADAGSPDDGDDLATAVPVEEGPVHRPLIRATLPRPEGQKEVRQVTDFTVRHRNGGRDNAPFRAERSQPRGAGGVSNGGRPGVRRFAGGGTGSGAGAPGRGGSPSRGGGGFRGANGPQRPGGGQGNGAPRGKKRSR
jgi:hypothetical protein